MYRILLTSLLFLSPVVCGAVVRTVCASGCDHTTILAAETASADGDIIEIQDSRTYDESWKPDGERTLRSVSGQTPTIDASTADIYSVDASAFLPANEAATVNGIDHGLTIVSTRFENTNSGTSLTINDAVLKPRNEDHHALQIVSGTTTVVINRCEIDGGSIATIRGVNYGDQTGKDVTINNCPFFNFDGTDAKAIVSSAGGTDATKFKLINNTIANSTLGYSAASATTMTNNIFADNTDDILISDDFAKSDATFNIFEQADEGGFPASNFDGANIVVTFVAAGSDDFRLDAATTIAIDDGTTSSVSDDFFQTSRPQGSAFDIGFHELIQAVLAVNMVSAGVVQKVVAAGVNQKIVD